MATNLVSAVMQFLTPDMIGRIATALGLDRNKVQSAVSGGVPALLAAFSGVAAQPGGAQKLAEAARQQTDTLGNLASMLTTGGESSFLEKGTQMLSSLLGSQNQNALTEAIAKFAGTGQNASASLLGMLGPIVMGAIGQHQGAARALDANGIANLFASQKNNIAAAIPAGLGSLLGGTGLLNSLGDAARTATAAGSEAIRETSASRLIDAARQRGGRAPSTQPNWLYWLLPAAVAAALLVYFAVRPTEEVVPQGMSRAEQGMSQAQNAAVQGLTIGKQVANNIASARTALNDVTDVPSAQAALPKLQEATVQIEKTGGEIGQLSADQRKLVAGLVNPLMPAFNQLCDKVLAIPGVAEVLKPSVDTLKAKLTALVA
ncbi:MAG TPA: DUF937 domain-containing protein [Xanthobacteraceae bacterium]|nr:DUF937 domain-containing protein [Xanthobacteraceae bacterium]